MNETHLLLRKFCDPTRKNIDKPFAQDLKIGRYLCATDAHFVILVQETEDNKIENDVTYFPPNIDGILPNFDVKDEIKVDFKKLKQQYIDVPIIERFATHECESCEGEGKFEHWGEWYDCKICKKGVFTTTMKEKVKTPNTAFKFGDKTYIKINYIKKLIVDIIFSIDITTFTIVKMGTSILWLKLNDGIFVGIAGLYDIEEIKELKIVTVELPII